LPIPFRLTGFFNEFVDGVDCLLHFGVTENDSAEHDFFGQLFGFGLNHQHCRVGTSNDEVKLSILELAHRRAQHVLTIDVGNTGCTDRAVEWDAGDSQRCGGTEQSRNIGVDFRVQRHYRSNNLDFVIEAFREKRTKRTIDQAAGQRFLFGRTPFALEESTRDTASSVNFFLVINSQREEILAWLGTFCRHNGDQHHGFFHRYQYGTASLAGNFAGFQGDLMVPIGEGLFHDIKHKFLSLSSQ
jgi:hypothetical protein